MYKTLKYNPPTLRKFRRKVGQVTEKFGKNDTFTKSQNAKWSQDKRFVITFDHFWPVLLSY